jgi:hypothetical protein
MTDVDARYFRAEMRKLRDEADAALQRGGFDQLTHARVRDFLIAAERAFTLATKRGRAT